MKTIVPIISILLTLSACTTETVPREGYTQPSYRATKSIHQSPQYKKIRDDCNYHFKNQNGIIGDSRRNECINKRSGLKIS